MSRRCCSGRGTVYLLGAEDAQLAPLLTALTGHIARTGRQVAGRLPDGRLDPPATFALDEAAIICLIPLDKWTSDFGGRNMPMHILAQSSAQLAQRWGQHGGAAITNNAGAVVIFGGTKDEAGPARALHADRRPRRTRRHPRSPRQGDLRDHPPGADLQPGPARAAAPVPGGGDPPRPAAGDRQGRAVLEAAPTTAP